MIRGVDTEIGEGEAIDHPASVPSRHRATRDRLYEDDVSLGDFPRAFHTEGMPRDASTTRSARQPRTVLITGGTSGIGYAAAASVLRSDGPWHVIVANRDATRAKPAVDELR